MRPFAIIILVNDKISLQTGALPTLEEIEVANFLASKGKSVRFLAPSQQDNVRTPDIEMDGVPWEIKSPVGKSANTIKRAFKTALRQSKYIIFDLRHSKLPDQPNIDKSSKELTDIKSAKQLLIITKSGELLEISK